MLIAQLLGIACTLGSIYLTGRKSTWGPVLGAVGFIPWTVFALSVAAYPMIGLNVVITALHLNILHKWSRAHAA